MFVRNSQRRGHGREDWGTVWTSHTCLQGNRPDLQRNFLVIPLREYSHSSVSTKLFIVVKIVKIYKCERRISFSGRKAPDPHTGEGASPPQWPIPQRRLWNRWPRRRWVISVHAACVVDEHEAVVAAVRWTSWSRHRTSQHLVRLAVVATTAFNHHLLASFDITSPHLIASQLFTAFQIIRTDSSQPRRTESLHSRSVQTELCKLRWGQIRSGEVRCDS